MKQTLWLASAASLVAASSVMAADLPTRKVSPVVPMAPAFTWTGFYAGVNAGANWSNRNVNATMTDVGNQTFEPFEMAALTPTPFGNTRAGFIGGVQLGYNYQINQFVLGAEIDFMGMSVHKTSANSTITNVFGTDPITSTFSAKVQQNWLGTLRARAGFAIDRVMIYGTAGLAVGNAKVNASTRVEDQVPANDYVGNWQGSKDTTKAGFVVGAGLEYAITNNWTLRGEYLYYNLGNVNVTSLATTQINNGVSEPNEFTSVQAGTKTTIDGNIVRAALNYKF